MARVFMALLPPAHVRGKITAWQERHKNFPARRVAGKNLHVTLVPPWEEHNIEEAIGRLKVLERKLEGVEVPLKKISLGPNAREPKLIWASGTAGAAISELRLKIYQSLGQIPEPRPFVLHMTLARLDKNQLTIFKDSAQAKFLETDDIDWRWRADKFALMQSRLSPEGANYEVLAEIELK